MARIKSGMFGAFIGKIGNVIGYERLGQHVARSKTAKSTKSRTPAQLAVNAKFRTLMAFLSPINDFINVGFKYDVAGTAKIAQNGAVSHNLQHAIKGEYPHFEIDYSQVLVSKGNLPIVQHAQVELADTLLNFKWDIIPDADHHRQKDQVMMLAYFPDTQRTRFILSGARRKEGKDSLDIFLYQDPKSQPIDTKIETYIAFIADDRQSISNSIYTGSVALK